MNRLVFLGSIPLFPEGTVMVAKESISITGPHCEHGSDCPCPVLELIDGKILFVGTPSQECSESVAYEDGRVCTCVRRNQNLSVVE